MARLLLLDVIADEVREVECSVLDDYYNNIQCDTIDIARRNIGGKYFDIFVDDEGLLKPEPIPSAFMPDGNVGLVGNLIFANHDAEGRTTDLTDEDIRLINDNIFYVGCIDADDAKIWRACSIDY